MSRVPKDHPWHFALDDIYSRASQALEMLDFSPEDALLFGPAHIVWEDDNYDLDSVRYCLKCCDDLTFTAQRSPVEIAIVRWSLERIIEVFG